MAHLPWNHANVDENAIILAYNSQLWKKRLLHSAKLNAVRFLLLFEFSGFHNVFTQYLADIEYVTVCQRCFKIVNVVWHGARF